jgi:hypothetical protein
MTSDGHRQERAAERERILGEALAAAGILPKDLPGLGKSAAVKVEVAQAIQARTLASSAWLAKARRIKGSGRTLI